MQIVQQGVFFKGKGAYESLAVSKNFFFSCYDKKCNLLNNEGGLRIGTTNLFISRAGQTTGRESNRWYGTPPFF
jgi:hypothetical protein